MAVAGPVRRLGGDERRAVTRARELIVGAQAQLDEAAETLETAGLVTHAESVRMGAAALEIDAAAAEALLRKGAGDERP
jgi:hypothetical protein